MRVVLSVLCLWFAMVVAIDALYADIARPVASTASLSSTTPGTVPEPSFASFDGAAIVSGLERMRKQPPQLLSPEYEDAAIRAMVLEHFPIGTPRTSVLKEFPIHFIVFDLHFTAHTGGWIGQDGGRQRGFGTNVLTLTVYKGFPLGLNVPCVFRRYVMVNFDGDADLAGEEGHLLDVRVSFDIDAP